MMDLGTAFWQELTADLPGRVELARIVVRLSVATVLGGVIGYQRGRVGKAAGLRTHILVALGTALVVLVPVLGHIQADGISRVIQGALTGIGFIGAGSILKMSEEHHIVGVTTAASIWLTATVGVAVGAGHVFLGVAGTLLALITLTSFARVEHRPIAKDK
jgi:putative Mg2+ transporter-C (MgtC) family protein